MIFKEGELTAWRTILITANHIEAIEFKICFLTSDTLSAVRNAGAGGT
jgi:hypothetical protein